MRLFQSLTGYWTAQGQAFVKALEQAGKTMTDGMQAMVSGTVPAMPTDLYAGAGDDPRQHGAAHSETGAADLAAGPVGKAAAGTTARTMPRGHAAGSALVAQVAANPANAMSDAADFGTKLPTGGRLLHALRDQDVGMATSPKHRVCSQDKVRRFHHRPSAEKRIGIPGLLCHDLIGRWTMADLQEDRSLVRNRLDLGLDPYVVDWGNPSRADRYLTLDDYIRGMFVGGVCEGSTLHKLSAPGAAPFPEKHDQAAA